jgi:2-phospho-L-lactate/phosphoenolpyruvate guanylyltransferase
MRVLAVPVKSLSRAKSRLAPLLSPFERAALTLAMYEDVLDATLGLAGWETWVVSPDEAVLEVAARRGAEPVAEARPPLAAAIRQVEEVAAASGAGTLAVLLADVPGVTPAALGEALATLGPVVLAPSEAGGGTNLLVRRPPRVMPARFGTESFAKHLSGARRRGLPAAVSRRPELTFDVDTPDDLAALLRNPAGPRTRAACAELEVGARLAART